MIARLLLYQGALATGLLAAAPLPAQDKSQDEIVISAPGRVEGGADVMPIGTAANGIVRDLLVKEGDQVKKGQNLVQLDCRVLEAAVRQREADLAASEVALNRTRAGPRDEEIAIQMAIVKVSEARSEEADKALQRISALQEGTASQARILEVSRDSKIAAAQLLEDRQRLRMLQAGSRGEDVLEAESKNTGLVAALDEASARLDQCTIHAPTDGTVLVTSVTPGQFVGATAGQPLLLKMVDDSVLRVRAEVDERDLQKVCLGQRAKLTADGFKGVTLTGKVTQINPAMGRRTILTGERTEKADRDIRELLVTIDSEQARWPIGLRVLVFLMKC